VCVCEREERARTMRKEQRARQTNAGLCKKEARQKSTAVATSRRVKEAATLHLTNQAPSVSNIHNRHVVET